MNISVFGVGYVGLCIAAFLCENKHRVTCYDINSDKLNKLNDGIIPFFEPKLEELIKKNLNKKLFFTDNISDTCKNTNVFFVTVGTPSNLDGSADISQVEQVIKNIVSNTDKYSVIINKSTVPIGTSKKIAHDMQEFAKADFDIVSNPEFLSQGNAVDNVFNPQRVIIGTESKRALKYVFDVYKPVRKHIIVMNQESAETVKYAANAFLATKISFINEISNLCNKTGADISMVALGIGSDKRIGKDFLNAGIGYGGSCFPKDTTALIEIAKNFDANLGIVQATVSANNYQRLYFADKILKFYNNDISGKTISIWGLSFKPNTDDTREAPSFTIINQLLKNGAIINVYDPKAMEKSRAILGDSVNYFSDKYDAISNSSALIILTEWDEFKNANLAKISGCLKDNVIFDGRNIFSKQDIDKVKLKYICMGKYGKEN